MSDFSKVLFVTPVAFNRISGGGITFSNLFRGWPKSALATVHNDPEPTLDDVCERYYVLGPAELDLAPPYDRLRRHYRAAATPEATATTDGKGALPPGLASRLKQLALCLLGDSFPERAELTPALERWIEEFQPQVLYTILGSNGMMALIEEIQRRFDLPLVVHIMDDWVSSYHRQGLLAPGQRRRMLRQVDHFFHVADRCLGISPAMCEAYARRYGREFEAFQNTIDVSRWGAYAKKEASAGSPADLLYVGSIFANAQLESLVDCCRAVNRLNAEGLPVTLTIVAPREHAARFGALLTLDPAIRLEPPIEDNDVFFRRIAAADALLLPVNFNDESIRFIRYSMPTKVPAYLTVGTPILAYGPAVTAQVDYALKAGWAELVTRRDPDALADGLRRVICDTALRARLSANARAAAAYNHDAARVRTAFKTALRDAAGGCKAGLSDNLDRHHKPFRQSE